MMRASIFTLAAAGVLAVAVPASALTVQPVSASPAVTVVRALSADPVTGILGAGAHFAALAGDSGGASGLPVYFEPTQAGTEADETRYAADPVRFMAQVNGGEPATNTRNAPSTVAAPKAPLNGR